MAKFADAIRDRRKSRQRRLGFGAAAEEPQPSMLVGTIGVVEGADFCLALSDEDIAAAESGDVDLWGTRVDALTPENVASAKDRGAAFVSFEVDGARADSMLDDEIDYVVRLADLRIEEADARALGSLRPAELAVEVDFPVSLSTILGLRRLAMFASSPMGVKCPVDISSGDIEALRDSGVAVFVLGPDASADDVAAVKGRIADLPERKSKRDEDAQPLIPTMRAGGDNGTEEG
ncbi:MAG: hypothetical protein F4Y04_03320 [Chloroflexi bacterium]|nr:hypothetical protein [Chloroflexota bacterium]